MLKVVLSILAALALVGCTSLQVLHTPSYPGIQRNIEPGSSVRIVTVKGTEYQLDVTAVSTAGVSGVINGRPSTIPYAQIKTIETRKFSPGKTAGLLGGLAAGALLLYAVGALIFLGALH